MSEHSEIEREPKLNRGTVELSITKVREDLESLEDDATRKIFDKMLDEAGVALDLEGVDLERVLERVLDLEILVEKMFSLEKMSTLDQLTGCKNRNGLKEVERRINGQIFASKYGYQERRGEAKMPNTFVLFVDLDKFKNLNDTYGHPVGDEVLKAIGKILRERIRDTDEVIRYGGDEFVLILQDGTTSPHLNNEAAKRVANEIREKIEIEVPKEVSKAGFDVNLKNEVGVSIGVKGISREINSLEDAISRADGCLYKAKEMGRNVVIAWSDLSQNERNKALQKNGNGAK